MRSWLLVAALVLAGCGTPTTAPPATPIEPVTTAPIEPSTSTTAAPGVTSPPTVAATTLPPRPEDPCAFLPGDTAGFADELVELSGIAASRSREALLWAHNDSGDTATLYALAIDGDVRGRVELADVVALDWEDIAIGPGPNGRDHLFVGDIGDNLELRSLVNVYRLPEPDPADGEVPAERLPLEYPDGRFDAEALFVDPVDGDLFIITNPGDGPGRLYRAAASDLVAGERLVLETLGPVALDERITAADVSVSGDRLLVRTLSAVYVWPRVDNDFTHTVAVPPCEAPSVAERQGEAIAALPDGGYVTISEGRDQPISVFAPG